MTTLEWLEALSYVVTIVGLPFAIIVFLKEQRKERQNDDEDMYLQLSDEYAKFLRLMLDHADLHLSTRTQPATPFTSEQIERRNVLFELLISIFERAYILVYEERMGRQAARLWQTWADYIREWCRRPDFRELLPTLLQGEDPEFQQYICKIAEEESDPNHHVDPKPDLALTIGITSGSEDRSSIPHRSRRSRHRNRIERHTPTL
jgi:hypothetical protein